MGKSTKILSVLLAATMLSSSAFLFSCEKPSNEAEGATDNAVVASNYIIKTEIKDGCIWVTYSNAPDTPVNIGAMGVNGEASSETSLTYMPLPDGSYGVTAGNSRYLDTIVIPETFNGKPITTIVENAFNGATHLKNITIPSSVTSVGDNAFFNCGELQYNEHDNALYLGNHENPYLVLVKAKDATITRCAVSEKTVAICDNAFYGCTELTSISIPSSVKSIGSYAFQGCASLGEANIPEGCTFIGTETFDGCASLSKITIPSTVTNIGMSAFSNCVSLKEVSFAKNSALTSIANAAFSGCKSLKSITVPKSVKLIGDNKATINTNGVFNGCSSLETVTFEEGSVLEQIGNFAFASCSKLESISLPASVKQIGHSSFRTSGLKSIELPASLTTVGDNTFYGCKSLKTVTFGNKLNRIGYQAFAACQSLNNVVIPESVKIIGQAAFNEGCTSLDSIEFKDVSGWYDVAKMEKIDPVKFSDPATAAEMLKQANTYSAGFCK